MSSSFTSQLSTRSRLVRSASAVGLATFASRVLGFVRDVLIAGFFGTTPAAQAFVIAFLIPNLLRDLVAEGAANSAFIPVLSRYAASDQKELRRFSGALFNWIVFGSMALSLLGMVSAPAVVTFVAPGFLKDPSKFQLTVSLTRFLFPFIFLVALSAHAMAVLNTLGHFSLPALGPCILNLCMIGSILWLSPHLKTPIFGLAIGVLIGGLFQFLIQWPILSKKGFRYEKPSFSHPGVKESGRLLVPRIFGTAVYQLNVIVDRAFASLSSIVGEGGVAALYYANRVIQFPLALFGVSVATVALPTLSAQATTQDLQEFKRTLRFSLRSTFFVTVPSAIGLIVLAQPIVRLLFERGSFDRYSTSITSSAIFYYGFGLLAFSGIKILTSAFYSLQDTGTPVKTAAVAVGMNVVLNSLLMFPLRLGGIALATALSASFNLGSLLWVLRRKIGPLGGTELWQGLRQFLFAGCLMGIFLWGGIHLPLFAAGGKGLLILICLGGAAYFGIARLLQIPEAEALWRWIFKRR